MELCRPRKNHDTPEREGKGRLDGISPFGALDMAGNVHCWCIDAYRADTYQRYMTGELAVPLEGNRVVRGGAYSVSEYESWFRGGGTFLWPTPPTARKPNLGFRCVLAPKPKSK